MARLGNNWTEGYVRPAITGTWKLRSSSECYGKLSAAGERTYAIPPPLVGRDQSHRMVFVAYSY